MALPTNFISDVFNKIDALIGNFVQNTYVHLVANNSLAIAALVTLYIMFLGYDFYYERQDFGYCVKKLVAVILVWVLLLNWSWYSIFYNIFTNEPEHLASTILSGAHQSASTMHTLDTIWHTGMSSAAALYKQTGVTQLQFLIYAISAFVTTLILCSVAAVLFIFAKIGMAIILAIAPLFIVAYLFDAFKQYTGNWLTQCVYFALIPIVTTAIIALSFTLINSVISGIDISTPEAAFSSLCAYCTIGFITIYMLLKVQSICASLSGGVHLSGITGALGAGMAALALKTPKLRNPIKGKRPATTTKKTRRNRK